MSQELATQNATPPALPSSMTLGNLEQQAQSMGNAMKIAEAMCSTQLVPKAYFQKPMDGAAAIMYGAELGMNAIQSLQQVLVVNGKPGIEARTMVALLKMRGYMFSTEESSPERVTVKGTSPRGEVEVSTWTLERAQKAGFTRNKLYQQIPDQMLYAKAATEVCRRLAPDVLMGMAYSTEELQLQESAPIQASAERMDTPPAQQAPVTALDNALAPEPSATAAPGEPDLELEGTLAAIRGCTSFEEMAELKPFVEQFVAQRPGHQADIDQVNSAWTETEAALR